MAIAKIEITCTACGCTFTHRKECRNRSDAYSYEAWAAEHIDTCPECSRKQRRESKAAALAAKLDELGITLPTIEGVSDKQIAYAESVRERYLSSHLDCIDMCKKVQDLLADEEQLAKYASKCAEMGITVEESIRNNLKHYGLTIAHIMLTSTSARQILDSAS